MPSGGLKHFQKVSWQTALLEIGKLPANFICLVLAGALGAEKWASRHLHIVE